ncbi:hypothetical protein DCO58_07880 [Helicobacter saguini]|uniref:Uncharacterized protein n=1 Tax=Helicobacter saguini TaxID=1548018 RepID=A0A347VNI7_9HELI|nr:hypothetical protein [Helicobacter saguini]MWV61752.1 hypothetical protein [Helicobacter saguini]MWV67575.1 hypothetical protein [Helicobacter saguini]MWV69926.1 hypothetical protein [Helicobacter saguini]MWV72859.1 hypothetical protein [Helicobacter saguini]TLD91483.1 hypothetical protein LS64_011940 [Helicobacter saguini]
MAEKNEKDLSFMELLLRSLGMKGKEHDATDTPTIKLPDTTKTGHGQNNTNNSGEQEQSTSIESDTGLYTATHNGSISEILQAESRRSGARAEIVKEIDTRKQSIDERNSAIQGINRDELEEQKRLKLDYFEQRVKTQDTNDKYNEILSNREVKRIQNQFDLITKDKGDKVALESYKGFCEYCDKQMKNGYIKGLIQGRKEVEEMLKISHEKIKIYEKSLESKSLESKSQDKDKGFSR